MDDQVVEEIVARHRGSLGSMLTILSEVQAKYGYLPQDALRRVAKATGDSLTDIYAVVTFYKAFSLKPRGKHLVSVCLGTACHVRGAPKIAEEVGRQLGIGPGETTRDKEFSLETVNCLGACALGRPWWWTITTFGTSQPPRCRISWNRRGAVSPHPGQAGTAGSFPSTRVAPVAVTP